MDVKHIHFIGFDLGHGQTALASIPTHASARLEILEINNKSDKFPNHIGYGDIIREFKLNSFRDRLDELENLRIKARQCSALYGENIQEEMTWLVKNML
jgi:hypothetical protein